MELSASVLAPALTICLNMIVKNEGKILHRMFDSVLPIIDVYCICDTGSTDDTVQQIKDYFAEKNIPGKVVEAPFTNFRDSRNVALQSCIGMSDFVLLMDADMVLDIRQFDKNTLLNGDNFTICQGNDSYFYKNTRIVRNHGKCKYMCVTHEYIDTPSNDRMHNLKPSELFIKDIGDGGSKSNKFERDKQLLLDGIRDEPENVRYYFYLANTYHDLEQFDEAIQYYKKRAEMGGWSQEVWYSYFRMGKCYKQKGNTAEAINCFLNAYNVEPKRVENLYELVQMYRCSSHHKLAKLFCDLAISIVAEVGETKSEFLFLQNDVYTHKLLYERTIISCYNNVSNINNEVVTILNHSTEPWLYRNLQSNMKFYKFVLPQIDRKVFDQKIDTCSDYNGNIHGSLYSSSSCLIPDGMYNNDWAYLMNIRYVSYYYNDRGDLGGDTITCNKRVRVDSKLEIIADTGLFITDSHMKSQLADKQNPKRLYGVEDVRIFKTQSGETQYLGTGLHSNGCIGIVHGTYKDVLDTPTELKSSFSNESCEKNWVYVGASPNYSTDATNNATNNAITVIYKWNPMQICEIRDDGKLYQVSSRPMPRIFNHVRGSSSGFEYENEIWFVVHMVSYESPRHYYHMLVVLDSDMNLLRYSAPFKFEGINIEFCLSILVESNRVLMNYSTMDRTTRIGVYDKMQLEQSVLVYK